MTKKSIIVISTIIISTLLGLNIYMYLKSYQTSQYVYESNTRTENIVLIDKFRININKMAQAQKLYLVTSKEVYRKDYKENLTKIYSMIDELEKSGSINNIEKSELLVAIDAYASMDEDMIKLTNNQNISIDVEKAIVKSNQTQLNILEQLDSSIDETKENLIKQNNTFKSQVNAQKNLIQSISTFLTVAGSAFVYYVKKNPLKFGNKIGKVINCLSNDDNDTKTIKDINNDTKIIEEINNDIKMIEDEISKIGKCSTESKKCINNLLNHEKNLESIKLINKESNNLSKKILQAEEIIDKVDTQIKKLIIDIEEIKECSSKIQSEKIRNIEEEMVELRIIFETLSIYCTIILDISNNIKSNNKVEEL